MTDNNINENSNENRNENNNDNFNKYFKNVLIKLNIEDTMSNQYKLDTCKLFIHRLKKNKESLKLFKNRNYECFNLIPFFSNENDKLIIDYLKDKETSDEIWSEFQLIILLYEINNNGSKKFIKKLYKKIKFNNKDNLFDDDIKKTKDYVNSDNGFKLPDLGNINLDNMKNMFGEPDKEKTEKTKSLLNNIFDDIKNKLESKDSLNTSDIFSISKELSDNYKNKINPSELSIGSVFSSIVDLVKNPDDITSKFKGMDKKIKTNPNEMMKEMQKNLFGDKNPMDLINNFSKSAGLGDNLGNMMSSLTNNLAISNDENKNVDLEVKKKEVDEFYNNLEV